MFEKFSDKARRLVVLAQEEARLLQHNYIGTEHLLLGMAANEGSTAQRVLKGSGVELEQVRTQVLEMIGQGSSPAVGHIPFTPRAKKVLELSLREALELGHNYVGTEHLLLGLLQEGSGIGAQVLGSRGIDYEAMRSKVEEATSNAGVPAETRLLRKIDQEASEEVPEALVTDEVSNAMLVADTIAKARGSQRIDLDDILLGIAHREGTLAQKVLQSFGLTLESLRKRVNEIRKPQNGK